MILEDVVLAAFGLRGFTGCDLEKGTWRAEVVYPHS